MRRNLAGSKNILIEFQRVSLPQGIGMVLEIKEIRTISHYVEVRV
jgi:hypothetical protein